MTTIHEYRCNARNDLDEEEVTVYARNAKDALKAARRRVWLSRYGGAVKWTVTREDDIHD